VGASGGARSCCRSTTVMPWARRRATRAPTPFSPDDEHNRPQFMLQVTQQELSTQVEDFVAREGEDRLEDIGLVRNNISQHMRRSLDSHTHGVEYAVQTYLHNKRVAAAATSAAVEEEEQAVEVEAVAGMSVDDDGDEKPAAAAPVAKADSSDDDSSDDDSDSDSDSSDDDSSDDDSDSDSDSDDKPAAKAAPVPAAKADSSDSDDLSDDDLSDDDLSDDDSSDDDSDDEKPVAAQKPAANEDLMEARATQARQRAAAQVRRTIPARYVRSATDV
jgi:hypothetical protein